MNQILQTKLKNKKSIFLKNKKFLKFQLSISILFIIIIVIFISFNTFQLSKSEKYSSQILSNYNITRLYASLDTNSYSTNYDFNNIDNFSIIGIIEIPKINIYYPILSRYNDELLKISPCKFYGPSPGQKGNLCIAGHNYDNEKFFSKINTLNLNDEIIIYNSFNKKISYFVTDIYEVNTNDLSPIYNYDENLSILTLITCNNLNKNRIIVRAVNS